MKKYIVQSVLLVCFYCGHEMFPSFQLGVENIPPSMLQQIMSKSVDNINAGLITNQTGVNQHNVRTIDVLLQKKCCNVACIFVPEHGLTGIAAEKNVPDSKDEKTGIPIISLYHNGTGKMIPTQYIKNIDVLIFDIQDSGMRHYTYISTLLNSMKIAAEHNKNFVVLDRPNPLGGLVQGPLVDSDLISFISIAPIPLRHGMTVGELARYFNKHVLKKSVNLHVVPMTDYNRSVGFMGKWLQQLSPNIQSLQSCLGYSFLGLLGEVEPFDVGVGTLMAFRCILLPETLHIKWHVWEQLKSILRSYGINSIHYKRKNPQSKKYTQGLKLEFSDIDHVRSFNLFMDIVEFFKKNDVSLTFSKSFDKAVGTKKVRDVIAGRISRDTFTQELEMYLQQFKKHAQTLLLYTPNLHFV